jgi:sugar phosphate isomerase/epimerase
MAVATGLVLPRNAMAAAARPGLRRLQRLGLITNSIAKPLQADPRKTLAAMARLGFRELEFGKSLGDLPRDEAKAVMRDLGLQAVAGGGAFAQFEKDLGAIVEDAHFWERKYVVCYWPWSDDGKNKSLADWRRQADEFNELGARLKKEGLTLAYHNHALEFPETEGRIPFDVLLESTDPASVSFELDLYWIARGGHDAVAYIRKHPGRFPLFHVKDMDRVDPARRVCVGAGKIDFAAIFAALADQGQTQHFFWELEDQDRDEKTQMACAISTARHLKKLRF